MSNLYHDTAEPGLTLPTLDTERRADVAIVGAGFTGLSAALALAEGGASVALLDAHEPGWGASGRNGGQVNPGLKVDPDSVERDFGADLGRRMNVLSGAAPAGVFDLIQRHGIHCEARQNGTLRAASHAKHAKAIRITVEQWQRRGAPVELLDRAAVASATGNSRYVAALRDARGGDLNPLSFARGLAVAGQRAGVAIFKESRALGLTREAGAWKLRSTCGAVTASHVVLATNGYTDNLLPGLRRTVVPVFGAIAASAPLSALALREVMPTRSVLYESGSVTVYYRVEGGGRLLIGGRGPMREIDSIAAIPHLTAYALRLWPCLGGISWTHAWGGRLAMTQDHYPHIHEPAPGVLAGLGYNGRGIAMSVALGGQLARRILTPSLALDLPITPMKTIALHSMWPAAVQVVIARGRIADRLGL